MNKRLPAYFFVLNSLCIAVVCALLCLRYCVTTDPGEASLSFTELFAFGNFFWVTLLLAIVFAVIPNIFRLRKTTLIVTLIVDAVLLCLLLTDTFVYSQFRLHLNIAMLQMTFLAGGQVVSFSYVMILEIIGMVLACFAVAGLCVWFSNRFSQKSSHSICVLVTMFLVFAATNCWYGYSYAKHFSEYTAAAEMVPFSAPLRFNKVLIKYGLVDEDEANGLNLSTNSSRGGMQYPLQPLKFDKGTEYNIVFIYVDALRADMLNAENMPKTWEFSKSAIRFDDHWSGGINTRHGIFTLFTGIPGSYWKRALANKTQSVLVKALIEKDYDIGIFTGAPITFPEFNQTVFLGIKNLRIQSKGDNVVERDRCAVDDFKSWLKDLPKNKPFFSFIFLDNVHAYGFPEDDANTFYKPYWKVVNHLELNNSFDATPYFNRYKNAVRFADSNIGIILDSLKSENLLSNTIVIIGSDHGEEFNDNKQNFWQHNGNFTAVQAKTPFIVYWPGKKPGVVDYRTSALDIVPTILPEVLGCINPTSDYSSGYSLWQKSDRPFIYCSNYSKEAYIEPERTVLINEKGIMDFVDNQNRKSENRDMPAYLKDVIKENSRFLK